MDVEQVTARMRDRLEELRRQRGDIDHELAQLTTLRDALRDEARNLELAINLYDEYARRTDGAPVPDQAEAFPLPLTGTLAEAAEELMRQNGGEMDLGTLHERLVAANKLKVTPYSRTTLWKTLNRKKGTFEKAGKGRWRLIGANRSNADQELTMTA